MREKVTLKNQMVFEDLMELKKSVGNDFLFPVQDPKARNLVPSDPYAFCIASCLDRGTRAEIICTIPYWISLLTGHLNPAIFNKMPLSEIKEIFAKLPRKPRFINAAPRTFQSITRLVIEEFDGNPRSIWEGKKASEVKETFLSVYGVGNGIANMILILIEDAYGVSFSDLDHAIMDIKPDVHTMRVLYRLGISLKIDEESAIEAARRVSPEYPGAIDGPLWYLGRTHCHADRPGCGMCEMNQVCQKVGVEDLN